MLMAAAKSTQLAETHVADVLCGFSGTNRSPGQRQVGVHVKHALELQASESPTPQLRTGLRKRHKIHQAELEG